MLILWSRSLFKKLLFAQGAGIATGYELDDREVGVPVPVSSRIFIFECLPDGIWGPPSLLYNGYQV
jgi:hypothetical protein